MTKQATIAALIKSGRIIGWALTAASNGDIVSYGDDLGNCIHELGRARVSRGNRWLRLISEDDSLPRYAVNIGGGAPF